MEVTVSGPLATSGSASPTTTSSQARGAAPRISSWRVGPADAGNLRLFVPVGFSDRVLPTLARGVALGAEAPGVGLTHDAAVVGDEGGPVRLLDGPPGKA